MSTAKCSFRLQGMGWVKVSGFREDISSWVMVEEGEVIEDAQEGNGSGNDSERPDSSRSREPAVEGGAEEEDFGLGWAVS